jgi:hypothetical protein
MIEAACIYTEMARDIVYVDLETQRTDDDAGS